MGIKVLILALIVLNSVKGEDEPSLESYNKLNTFEMISQDQSFKIKTTEPSIAYFDSFDGNSIVYITTKQEDFKAQTDERITGKFYHIDANVEYYVRNHLYHSFFTSTFKKYLYPADLSINKISIVEENINYLYLQKENTYKLDFKDNAIKRMIKLSRKTPNSIVTVTNQEEKNQLTNETLYYKLEDDFTGELELKVEEDDAFIEFLSNEGEYEVLKDVEKMGLEIKNKATLIKIDKTQKDFIIQLNSDKPFNYSFSYGFSGDENYYYSLGSSPTIASQKQDNNYIVLFKLFTPFKNIKLTENELLSFLVNVEFEPNQNVTLSYMQDSELSPLMDEKLEKEYCEEVKKYLKEVFELYIFTDIAKNPPIIEGHPNYHHKPIDIQQSLEDIQTENRYFYEFYQEIMKILTATKDLHLSIYSFKTPKGIIFEQYGAALPFAFVIKNTTNDTEEGEFKMYIDPNFFFGYYEESVQQFIFEHIDIPLKTIEDQDPFDYIQNWSKYTATKNDHAQFTYLMAFKVISGFYLRYFPLDYSDLNLIQFEFEDNKILRIPYHIVKPNMKDVEFNEYFHSYLKDANSQADIINIPFINEIRDKYLIYKGKKKIILKEDKKEEIEWNVSISSDSGFIKCKVDEKNEVNVVLQTTFSVNYYLGIAKIIECAKLFHTNAYPIIIIESKNGGGTIQLYLMMHQLFQMRTVDRSYFSYRMSDATELLYEGINNWVRTDMKTCKQVKSYADYQVEFDHYNYNGLNVEHKRSGAVDLLAFYFRTLLRDYRENYLNDENLKKNLKRPTDIIIFTDSFSYSSTSGFIKAFQDTGGAIIVGYFGNPKKKGTDLFDGSQSISSVQSINDFYLYEKLYNLGIFVEQVTVAESFDDSVYEENPIPREYALDPVDYRVNIYSSYSDNLYMKFIEEGKKIHKKFNEENYCNPKNDKLLLHNDCEVKDNPKAHGGYKCNPDTNKWDTNNCQPYYCDIGYYFNQKRKNCSEECSFEGTKSYFIYEDIGEQTYEIQNNQLTVFLFANEKSNNYYFYRASEDLVSNLPKIGVVSSGIIKLNENKDAKNNFELTINKIATDFQFELLKTESFSTDRIELFNQKKILILQPTQDHIFYSNDIFNFDGNEIKFASYNEEMKPDDIVLGNNKYFKDYTDNFLTLEKDKVNIIFVNYSFIDQLHVYFDVKNNSDIIEIEYQDTNTLYLQKDKEYILNFQNNTINRMIKLSRKTINSEINIKDENITLNSKNLYYQIKDDFKGAIKLVASKSDAIIEFLFKMPEVEVLDYEGLNKNTSKEFNLIKISKKYAGEIIEIKFKNNNTIFFNAFMGFCQPPYSYYFSTLENVNAISVKNNTFSLNLRMPVEDNLMKDEYFCVLIENLVGGDLEIKGDFQNKNKSEDKKGLETWKIILIIAASVIALLIIIIIVVCCCKRKSQLSNEEIEDKMENLNEIREL